MADNNDADDASALLSFDDCCKLIIAHQNHKALNWAVNYAKSGMHLISEEDKRVQALYMRNNITRWRGDVAKQVRNSLKAIAQG